jgi:ubiquinone/menaquinone biosynthesis C-methylase UbiE
VIDRIREWRIDRMTDRIARRPHGRNARATYGADDVHAFAWEPVLDSLELGPDDRLLDVGCGGGIFLRRTLETGCAAVGVDHSRAMVRLARRNAGVQVVQADAAALPFRDGEFTAVSCIVAFLFFAEPVAALREFRRVLDAARGRVAVYTTAPELKGTPAAPYPLATRGHFHTDDDLSWLAHDAGFTDVLVQREDGAQLLVARR